MTFAELLTNLSQRGLSVVRDGEMLCCIGDTSQLTPDLQAALSAHRAEFLRLLPSAAERCERIVEQATDDANRLCPWGRRLSETTWQALDEFQDLMHDCARLGDAEGTAAAAAAWLRVVECCCHLDDVHDWADATPAAAAAAELVGGRGPCF